MKYCPTSRPFASVDEMNAAMIVGWNSVVTDNDVVHFLGDFAFTTKEDLLVNVFSQLKGKKILIRGNHDSGRVCSLNWSEIHTRLERKFQFNRASYSLVLDHFPLSSWNHQHHGAIHLHGHVHSTPEKPFEYKKNRLDVGVDNIGFVPIDLESVIKRVSEMGD